MPGIKIPVARAKALASPGVVTPVMLGNVFGIPDGEVEKLLNKMAMQATRVVSQITWTELGVTPYKCNPLCNIITSVVMSNVTCYMPL